MGNGTAHATPPPRPMAGGQLTAGPPLNPRLARGWREVTGKREELGWLLMWASDSEAARITPEHQLQVVREDPIRIDQLSLA